MPLAVNAGDTEPHAAPLQLVPLPGATVHVTPPFAGSFETVAVICCALIASKLDAPGVIATDIPCDPASPTVITSSRLAVWDLASVTCTVNALVPVAVGVPEICPLLDSVNPAGKLPDGSDHEYGVVPSAATRFVLYAVDSIPIGSSDVATFSGGFVPPR